MGLKIRSSKNEDGLAAKARCTRKEMEIDNIKVEILTREESTKHLGQIECRSPATGDNVTAAPDGLSQTWSDKLRAGRQVAVWRVKQQVTLSEEEEECQEIRRGHCAGQQQCKHRSEIDSRVFSNTEREKTARGTREPTRKQSGTGTQEPLKRKEHSLTARHKCATRHRW